MYINAYTLGMDSPQDPLDEALTCANRAIRLDSLCQDAYGVLANIYFQRRDREGVRRVCRRSLELNPNDAANVGAAGFWLALVGDEENGLAHLDRAIKLNPFFPGWFHLPYFLHHFAHSAAEQAWAEALSFNMPGLFWDPLLRTVALSQLNRMDEAQESLRELLQLKPDFPQCAHHYLGMFIMAGDVRERMLAQLTAAGLSQG